MVRGCEGKGQAAADEFFAAQHPLPETRQRLARRPAAQPAIMVSFSSCPTVGAGHGIRGAWLEVHDKLEPSIFVRSAKLNAVSKDMGD